MTAPLTERTLDERRWAAVIARSYGATAELDPFVIVVHTTGIFCRVGCPARAPHRRNVHFFDTTTGAIDAGYRACKRCYPDRGDLAPWRPASTRTARRIDRRAES